MSDVDEGQHESGPDWSGLLPELLAHTFKNLSKQERGRAARVCVSWRDASYQKSVWKNDYILWTSKINVTDNTTLVPSLTTRDIVRVRVAKCALVENVARDFPNVLELMIGNPYCMSWLEEMNVFLISMRNLVELYMCNVFGISDSTVQLISENLGNLVKLSMKINRNLTDISFLAMSRGLKKLQHIRLDKLSKVTDRGIAYLTGCDPDVVTSPPPKLNHLNLACCPLLTDTAMSYLSIGQPGLKWLDVSHSKITDVGVSYLSEMTSLVNLNISYCKKINDQASLHLAGMPQLRELNLDSCDSISNAGLAHLVADPYVSGIINLNLRYCEYVSDDGMTSLAKIVNLRRLDLSGCSISDAGLAILAHDASKITALYVSKCALVTNEGMRHLSTMAHLTCLDVTWCRNITVEGLISLGTGVARIVFLNVNVDSRFGAQTLLRLAESLPYLEGINSNTLPLR